MAQTTKKQDNEKKDDLYEMLLDEENTDNITLLNNDKSEIEFEQIAVIPMEKGLFAILKPVEELEGVAEDEAIVFKLAKDENDKTILLVEEDTKLAEKVFEEYYKLLDEDKE